MSRNAQMCEGLIIRSVGYALTKPNAFICRGGKKMVCFDDVKHSTMMGLVRPAHIF